MFSSLLVPNTTAFEGVLLFLIALAVVYFLQPANTRRRATWHLAIFFICMSLLGFARILEGTAGGTVFVMLEDTFIIIGGLFLVQFSYAFPNYDQPGEARLAAVAYCLLVALSAGTILVLVSDAATTPIHYFDYPGFFHYLMPLAITVAVLICLRRALFYARQSESGLRSPVVRPLRLLSLLVRPPNVKSAAQRNLALAIMVGLIQILPQLISVHPKIGIYLVGVGGLLVVSSIAYVYYSHSLEELSFTARLVGISLTGMLMVIGITGIHSIEAVRAAQVAPISKEYQTVRRGIKNSGDFAISRPSLTEYLVSWPSSADQEQSGLQFRYLDEAVTAERVMSTPHLGGAVDQLHYGLDLGFLGISKSAFYRLRFESHGRIYEIGFPWNAYALPIQTEALKYIVIAVMATLFVVIFFPIFFRHHLFNPLNSLLNGVKKADKGSLDLRLPVYFEDEIGAITRSFNQLMVSLRHSNQSRDDYYKQLKDANDEMERRVENRTRELTEANRELVIARDEAGRNAVLEERHRLARDLHDAISQSLYGVMLFARASRDAQEVADWDKLRDGLKEIEENSLQTLKEMRLLLYQLRPISLDQGGLEAALDRRFGQVERRMGIAATVDLEEGLGLTREIEQAIYLIATEALNNSLKHSNSNVVHMHLGRHNGGVQLFIEDNGRGFDLSRPTAGMGINNIQERAVILGGSLEICSEPGSGTQICLNIPGPGKRENHESYD